MDTARIPLLRVEDMSPEQKSLHDAVLSGPRGQMIGPLLAAIHSPELAVLWSQFGEFLRYRTCLPLHLTELAIVATARRWNSQVEWWVHASVAHKAGVPEAAIEAVRKGIPPALEDEASREVYEYARLLQETGQVPSELHAAIKKRWGVRGVVELTAVIGYYTLVAMTLNAHAIPVPDGEEPPLERQDSLFSLLPATADEPDA